MKSPEMLRTSFLPTGAKGLNLAVADVRILGMALATWYRDGDESALESYSRDALRRVWRAEHFSWWMTTMLHRPPGADPFDAKLQLSQLAYVASSELQRPLSPRTTSASASQRLRNRVGRLQPSHFKPTARGT